MVSAKRTEVLTLTIFQAISSNLNLLGASGHSSNFRITPAWVSCITAWNPDKNRVLVALADEWWICRDSNANEKFRKLPCYPLHHRPIKWCSRRDSNSQSRGFWIQKLYRFAIRPLEQKWRWEGDSNPRGFLGPDALAKRCNKPGSAISP